MCWWVELREQEREDEEKGYVEGHKLMGGRIESEERIRKSYCEVSVSG